MRDFFLVGGGGFAGSVIRFYLGGIIFQACGAPRFPIATLAINALGCLLIGMISAAAEHFHVLTPQVRLLLITGFLGGFTTFSAFGYETYFLSREQLPSYAVANVLLQVGLGLSAVWAGHKIVDLLAV